MQNVELNAVRILGDAPMRDPWGPLLALASDLTQSSDGFVGFLDEEGALVALTETVDFWGEFTERAKLGMAAAEWRGAWGRALRDDRARIGPCGAGAERSDDPAAAAAAPIRHGGVLIGVIHVSGRRWGFGSGDLAILDRLAAVIGPYLSMWLAAERAERVEAELRADEAWVRAMVESASDAIVVADARERIETWNPAAERIFGYRANEVIGHRVDEFLPQSLAALRAQEMKRRSLAPAGGSADVGGTELFGRRRNGSVFPFEIGVNELTVGGRRRFVGTVRDISARKAAQAEVVQSNETLRAALAQSAVYQALFDGSFSLFAIGSVHDRTIQRNPAWTRVLGYTPAELASVAALELIHPDDRAVADEAWRQLAIEGTPIRELEIRYVCKNGSHKWLSWNAVREVATGRLYGIAVDVTERREVGDQIQRSHVILRQAGRMAKLGAWELELPGLELRSTEEFESIMGGNSREPFDYGRVLAAIDPGDRPRLQEAIERTARDGTPYELELSLHTPKGERRFVRALGEAVWVGDRIRRLAGTLQDVTGDRQRDEELRVAQAMANEGSRVKASFLANMSHELRTPLNGVIGMAGLLLDTPLSREQRDFAATLRGSAESLLAILNDILDYAKIEAESMELESTAFDVRALVEETLDLVSEGARAKRLDLSAVVEESVPHRLRGDPGRLRQILHKLLSNAVKFTKQGEVVVQVWSSARHGATIELSAAVRDTGPGIAREMLPLLFSDFGQLDTSSTRRHGGTGLGLAISKKLAALMGGDIRVESEPGCGATFECTVRVGAAEGTEPPPSSLVLGGRRILVVDDNAAHREMVRLELCRAGASVTVVASGAEALERAVAAAGAGSPFELLFMDYGMPHMDGITLAEVLADRRSVPRAPKILLSVERVDGLGRPVPPGLFERCLAKPVRAAKLVETAAEVLGGISAIAPPASGLIPALGDGLRVLVVEDNAVNQKVITRMLERMGFRWDVAANGVEAVGAVTSARYDLVLMDCQMPEMDGYEATRAIRRGAAMERAVPIVALTASAMPEDRLRCVEAGMDDFLSKPIQIASLVATLRKWLGADGPRARSLAAPSLPVV